MPTLAEALDEATLRRMKFEKQNKKYLEDKLEGIIEPMVISLLNNQPHDVLKGIEDWLLI